MEPTHVLSCRHCGTLQDAPEFVEGVLDCAVCRVGLERFTGRSLDSALAVALAALLFFVPANFLTFLTTAVFGGQERSRLISGPVVLWREGYWALGLFIGFVVVVAPIARFTLLGASLGAVKLGREGRWIGRTFRWSNSLQTWAMADVFLLGFLIAYARLASTVQVTIGPGAKCFIAAGVLTLLCRAVLDKRAIWEEIMSQPPVRLDRPVLSCEACELLVQAGEEGRPCPRCGLRLRARKRNAVGRAAAFVTAAILCYAPANILAFATLPINLTPTAYNILGGVKDLAAAGLYGLAALVFLASFLIPIAKLTAMAWFIHSVRAHSHRALKAKTRTFQIIDEIGRWSMVDPLTLACFVPVVRFNTLLTARADAAAPFFTAVVILTILAAKAFDPRLMWDVAETTP